MCKMHRKTNLAVLISGRGSNLKAIITSLKKGYLNANLAVVVANKNALGLKHAKELGIPYHIVLQEVNGKKIQKEEHDKKVMDVLESYNIDLIALAGYRQILQRKFVNRYKGRIINIHPSLLPSFGGTLYSQKDALEYGVKISGCTVHFVTEAVDTGPIIIQAAVPVKDDDTAEILSNRILEHEHIIYPKAIKWFSEGRLKIVGRRVIVKGELKASIVTNTKYQLQRIGVDIKAANLLARKKGHSVLVENITPREAMIIKQEMLSLGGDCAVPKECILNNLCPIDAIIIGTKKQLNILTKKLSVNVFNLPKLAEILNSEVDIK